MIHFARNFILMNCCVFFIMFVNLNVHSQTIAAKKVENVPVVDGKLDDSPWLQITPIEEFMVAELKTTVPDKTQVFIVYNDSAIYISFRCIQDKSTIIANQTRKDGSFKFEDHVAVYLDTYLDKQRTYRFAVNPLGTQLDEKQGDLGWDGEWSAAAVTEESSWTVEMKIPYQILDMPRSEKQTWGLNLVRRHQSVDRTSTWADTGVNVSEANRFGSLTDIEINPKNITKKFEVGAYLSAKMDDISKFDKLTDRLTPAIGVDASYKITTSTSIIGTLNPDFSHIESEVQGIVLSDLEQRLTDRRPFFQEDGRIFRAPISLFYSRRIGEIDYGAKLIGKTGRATYGLMNVIETEDGSHNILARGLWDAGNSSSIGAFVASKEYSGFYNRSAAVDTRIRLPKDFNIIANYAGNWEIDQDNRRAILAEINRRGNPIISLAYRDISSGFNPVNGLVRLTNIRQPSFWGVYSIPFEEGMLQTIKFESVQKVTWDHDGVRTRGDHFQLVQFDIGEKYQTGLFYRNWSYDIHNNWVVAAQTVYNRQKPDRIFVVCQYGEFEGAKATFVTTAMNLIPFKILSIGIEGENLWQTFPDGESTYKFSLRSSANFEIGREKWITFRLRSGGDHKPNLNAVFKYMFIEDFVLYLVYGDQDAEQTVNQLFAKIAYTW
ncbi:MAG: DUF5916 domain-containing protein [Candidatus Poribacteria bacterium]|nr:DUF5916 domain-containing protein [Candidatus Poribacteria bacterium]